MLSNHMITPYNWQKPSIDKMVSVLSSSNFCINASDTGTGKTITALATLKALRMRALIVCPKIVHTSWLQTAQLMACEDNIYGIINAERLQYKNQYFYDNTWQLPKNIMIVWDEVHRGASGAKSKTSKILALTRPLGYKVLVMSATIASSPLQMRAVGYLAGLHQFKPSSYYPWCLEHGCYKRPPIRGLLFQKGPSATRYMEKIGRQLQPIMTRVRIKDVPDFPETMVISKLYDLDAGYKKQIEEAWADMRESLREARKDIITERLRARETTELCKVALLTDLITEALEENKSVVVFTSFRSTLAKLQEACKQYKPSAIYGGQSKRERDKAQEDFQADKTHLILCMAQAGGVGINLHALTSAHRPRVSFLTPGDKADDFLQCLGRIHRSGGSKTIQTIVLAAGTVEEQTHRNIQGKLNNLSALQDGDLTI